MKKVIEVASFGGIEQAEYVASLLRAEGIACNIRGGTSDRVFQGLVDIGVSVEALESDLPRALEIMKDNALLPTREETENEPDGITTSFLHDQFLHEKQKVARTIILLLVLLAFLLTCGFYFLNQNAIIP